MIIFPKPPLVLRRDHGGGKRRAQKRQTAEHRSGRLATSKSHAAFIWMHHHFERVGAHQTQGVALWQRRRRQRANRRVCEPRLEHSGLVLIVAEKNPTAFNLSAVGMAALCTDVPACYGQTIMRTAEACRDRDGLRTARQCEHWLDGARP